MVGTSQEKRFAPFPEPSIAHVLLARAEAGKSADKIHARARATAPAPPHQPMRTEEAPE